MTFNIKELTELLEISDRGLDDLKKRIIESFDDKKKIRAILRRQCRDRRESRCLSCDDEGDCFILNGIMYLVMDDAKKSIQELENANQHLHSKGETWNRISGLVLLGIAYEKHHKSHQALREYKKACEILTSNYLYIHVNDYIEKARLLKIELQDKLKELSVPGLSVAPPPKKDSGHISSPSPSLNDKDYLALFSIPIYGTVEAGPNGELLINHSDTFTIVNQVNFEKQMYDVHSVHGTASGDRKITVMATKTHGWARVHGLSMNGWDISFDENDYVLFYEASFASHLDYVIASNRDQSGEIALIVKRFDEKNNQLLSKSKDTSKSYDPIPLDEDHQIVGVVIAVAKPAQ